MAKKIINLNIVNTTMQATTVTLLRGEKPLFFGKEHKFEAKPWKKKVTLSKNSGSDKFNTLKFVYYRIIFDKKNDGFVEVAFSYEKNKRGGKWKHFETSQCIDHHNTDVSGIPLYFTKPHQFIKLAKMLTKPKTKK